MGRNVQTTLLSSGRRPFGTEPLGEFPGSKFVKKIHPSGLCWQKTQKSLYLHRVFFWVVSPNSTHQFVTISDFATILEQLGPQVGRSGEIKSLSKTAVPPWSAAHPLHAPWWQSQPCGTHRHLRTARHRRQPSCWPSWASTAKYSRFLEAKMPPQLQWARRIKRSVWWARQTGALAVQVRGSSRVTASKSKSRAQQGPVGSLIPHWRRDRRLRKEHSAGRVRDLRRVRVLSTPRPR